VRKSLVTYILILIAAASMAQRKPKTTIVNLISSTGAAGIKINGEDVIKVYNGVFKQESTILRSDSAYFYQSRNSFDAFGNVNINQGDTLNVYGDKLYYNGNTHVALVTDNVRMVDRDATLTTNYLTYNTATRIGSYTGGGKLVNKENTLVSKNGYYFSNSRDAYFRYNVVLTTVDAIIKTDTLRYNSGTRISYFYGPTHILGKDKDTLYTENGRYNTVTEQAFFGKKNHYSQGTKSLKGDSLFYDRLKGYGRAVKNITFNDDEQKVTIKGNLGTFYRADDRAVVTENPYVIFVTEERDSTKKDSTVTAPTILKDKKGKAIATPKVTQQANPPAKAADTKLANNKPANRTDTMAAKPLTRVKRDSIYWGADTLETQIVTYKTLKEMQERMRLAGIRDTSLKDRGPVVKKKPIKLSTSKELIIAPPVFKYDNSTLISDVLTRNRKKDTTQKAKPATTAPAKKPAAAAIAASPPKVVKPDSVFLSRKPTLSDTSRIRILSAHHNAKIFKSDLQAKADSMFYSYSDSTMRCFVNPMFWTQGSQLSGDTIYLQLKNKKLDNMNTFPRSFTVNVDGTDSTNFNQVAGKRMRGFFVDGKLQRLFVDGNAETIYFNRDSSSKKVTDLLRTLSSRIRVNFKDNKVTNVTWYTKVEKRIVPIDKTKDDDKILKGFIWKPKDRPLSKEAVTSPGRVKANAKKAAPVKAPVKGNTLKIKPPTGTKPQLVDSLGRKIPAIDSSSVKTVRDSVLKLLPKGSNMLQQIKNAPGIIDTVKKRVLKDTTNSFKKP
jgi:lipopolysaccharide export system protein LptA